MVYSSVPSHHVLRQFLYVWTSKAASTLKTRGLGVVLDDVAYVSIRQHTSAYVSICEHTRALGVVLDDVGAVQLVDEPL
jgi:hypothetical protein